MSKDKPFLCPKCGVELTLKNREDFELIQCRKNSHKIKHKPSNKIYDLIIKQLEKKPIKLGKIHKIDLKTKKSKKWLAKQKRVKKRRIKRKNAYLGKKGLR